MRRTTLFQRAFGVLGLTVLTVIFLTCENRLQFQEQPGNTADKVSVFFTVTDGAVRTVLPQVSLAEVASYTLLGGKVGVAETVLAESFTGAETTVPLDSGTWNFTLNAYNESNVLILQGKVQGKEINLTGTNQVNFSLSGLKSGTGSIQITINFPETVGVTKISANIDGSSEDFTVITDGNFVYSKDGVDAGDHFINFEFYYGNALRTVVSELVIVRDGLTSAKTITLVGEDLKPLLTGVVSITGTAEVWQTLMVNTDSLGGNGILSYQWKRGGTEVGTNRGTYIVQSADIGSTITVTVTRSGYAGGITSAPTVAVVDESPATSGLSFELNNDNTAYSVSKGTATDAEVVIPSTYNGLPVTGITDNGFSSYTGMTSIKIPASVTSIGNSAFSDCSGLTSVMIPESVTSIGSNAFYNCSSLTSITIPFVGATLNGTSNTHFGYFFGASNYNNNSYYIPASLKTVIITGGNSIAASAFYYCDGLTSIIIPDSVTSIGYNAFYKCDSLMSVTIPDSVTSIGSSAFYGCWYLKSVTIPDSVTSIGQEAFSGCTGLTSVTIGNSVTSISSSAFYGCNNLTSVTIGNSVTSIGSNAFYNCSKLTSITIPNSVTSIGDSAFRYCSGLTSVTIGSSVTSIGSNAFNNCSGLTSVTFQGTISSANFNSTSFPSGDLREKYLATGGGIGTYTRISSTTWFKNVFLSENFEGTNSFTTVNTSQTNKWYVGAATSKEGKSAYISNDFGTSNAYTITSTSVVHMYRDVTFPASTTAYTLTFNWKAQGEGTSTTYYDYLRIFLIETSITPAEGSQPSGTTLGTYNMGGTTWNSATISIPATNSGTTKRLVFTWRNDSATGTQPPAAVDNIVLYY